MRSLLLAASLFVVLGQLSCSFAVPLPATSLHKRGLTMPKPLCAGNCWTGMKKQFQAALKGPHTYHMQSAKLNWARQKKAKTEPDKAAGHAVKAAMHKQQADLAGDASWYRYAVLGRKDRKPMPEEFDSAIAFHKKHGASSKDKVERKKAALKNPALAKGHTQEELEEGVGHYTYQSKLHDGILKRLTKLKKNAREPGPLEYRRLAKPIEVMKAPPPRTPQTQQQQQVPIEEGPKS